jgi:hypothetical protein
LSKVAHIRELCFDFEAKTEVKSTGKHGCRKTKARKIWNVQCIRPGQLNQYSHQAIDWKKSELA